jgi:hypothetical protein
MNGRIVKRYRRETRRYLAEHHRELFVQLLKHKLWMRIKIAYTIIFRIGLETNQKVKA